MADPTSPPPPMDGELAENLDLVISDVVRISSNGGFTDLFKKDCTDLGRRISLLSHLVEEIRDYTPHSSESVAAASSSSSSFFDLFLSLQDSRRLLLAASSFDPNEDGATKRIAFQFQCVTWKLEKALANIPYEQFGVSEEVQEQVELVRTQLKRATERYGGPLSCSKISRAASQPLLNELEMLQSGNKGFDCLHLGSIGNIDQEFKRKVKNGRPGNSSTSDSHEVSLRVEVSSTSASVCASNTAEEGDEYSVENQDESSKPESVSIPEDFLCPISLEIMRDPVIVATGQTYERSYIQRWIDSGNMTCPKTQQKLVHNTLTPNYVLRSLIYQWCSKNNIEQPTALMTGKIKKSDGSFRDVSGDIAAIQVLVRKLSSRLVDERRGAVAEIRSLSKRSTDNRILIAEAGAIPVLVNLLTNDDALTQENAVTSILNLSIYENNKELIMLAGAIPSIVQVLRNGSMEARENAAATLFSLSLADENKIIIGASGAIPALVNLLQNGSPRGKKDAATALFNLCIYQGNKGRAVRAGIIAALMKMLTESDGAMVDEALTILSVLAGHQEAKLVIVRACTIPVLIDLLRTGLPRNKENAAAILLALCKRDMENLTSLSRLGAAIPLTEITKSGTERAKRKATSLLELLKKLQQQQN
ncbi:U-box domain-containing protein 11-like [Chenopodium quinoa]|uniref:U-box domain-containing protein 11-like n=1 Tax=Chenopodium quinoa TaxID=63459 RepID=UPI000B77DD42|nr:U-box domain-containing protein 11-like [Chenopodium quinoa]